MVNSIEHFRIMPDDVFAALGGGQVAYLKPMTGEQLHDLIPDAPPVAPDLALWGLVGANGLPILITDSREAAIANAREHDLMMVALN